MAKKQPAPDTIAGYMAATKNDPARAIIRARVAADAPTLARIVRRLAGTFYRAAQWSRDTTRHERAAGFQCAAIVRRASAPRDWPDTWNLVIHAGPVPHDAVHGARHLPGSLVIEAGRIDATDARAAALDVTTDALIGLATFAGCDGGRWLNAWSVCGFGATMPDPEQWSAASVAIAWTTDEESERPASQRFHPIAVRCRAFAVEVLATQFAAEAAEPTRSPLARARRVAAVARLTRRAPVDPYGTDELADALRDYGARHVDGAGQWTDADGTDAWQTFKTEHDEQHDASSTRGGTHDLDAAAKAQRQAGEVAQDQEFRSEMRERQEEGDAAEGDAMQAAALDAAEALGQIFDGAAQADRAQDDRKYDPVEIN